MHRGEGKITWADTKSIFNSPPPHLECWQWLSSW